MLTPSLVTSRWLKTASALIENEVAHFLAEDGSGWGKSDDVGGRSGGRDVTRQLLTSRLLRPNGNVHSQAPGHGWTKIQTKISLICY